MTIYRFDRFEVRPADRKLLVEGRPVPLGARAFDLLLALIERRDRVVSKNELLDIVWPGVVVEENNLQVQVGALRKALGQTAIATVPGRGYRFTATIGQGPGIEPAASTAFAGPEAAPTVPGNLPVQLPPLIGREYELQLLLSEINAHPLVTLVGATGVGKTTLATSAAYAASHHWRDGAWKVELAPVTDPMQLPQAVAQSLGIALNGPGPAQRLLVGVLQARRLLLLLDNCEHVAAAAASLAAAIVANAPGVRILATSQERLNVANERVIKLDPLAVPGADEALADAGRSGALRLFAERAQAVDPRFALTGANIADVADICRQLDGLPLAIELAAARVRVLGVRGVRDRLGERFRLLTGGARTAMRRHQTLHAAIEWTHALLSVVDQTVFRRLGVFVGGYTLELAQRVAGDEELDEWDVLEALSALVDKSLVTLQGEGVPRYALMESGCAFALEKLAQAGETTEIRGRHAHGVRVLLESVYEARYGELGSLGGDAYAARLQPEIDNLRSALTWAAGDRRDESLAIALSVILAEALSASGRSAEAVTVLRAWVPRVSAVADHVLATRFWFTAGIIGRDRWPDEATYMQALAHAEQGCIELDWPRRLQRVRLMKAWRLMRRREYEAAQELLTEAGALEQPEWPGWLRSDRWNVQANFHVQTGAFEQAWVAFETMDALLPVHGEARRRTLLTLNRGVCCNFQRQWREAASLLGPLVDRARLQSCPPDVSAWAYAHLVLALTELGRLDEAHARLNEALPLWRADGILHLMMFTAIRLVVAQGRIADALRLLGMEDAAQHPMGLDDTLAGTIRGESQQLIEMAVPDPLQRERWRREGTALDEDASFALCLGWSSRSSVASAA